MSWKTEKKRTKQNSKVVDELVQSAKKEGIQELIKKHPRFKSFEKYLAKHIDEYTLKKDIQTLYSHAKENRYGEGRTREYILESIADDISRRGDCLDKIGKITILRKGELEKKANSGFFKGFSARKKIKQGDYIDKAIATWKNIEELAEEGEYNLPTKIKKPMEYLSRLGFALSAADLLKEEGLIKGAEYNKIYLDARKGAKEGHKEALNELKNYTVYNKVVASIIGILGFGAVILNFEMTGAVIGTSAKTAVNIIGVLLMLASGILFFISSKKKF